MRGLANLLRLALNCNPPASSSLVPEMRSETLHPLWAFPLDQISLLLCLCFVGGRGALGWSKPFSGFRFHSCCLLFIYPQAGIQPTLHLKYSRILCSYLNLTTLTMFTLPWISLLFSGAVPQAPMSPLGVTGKMQSQHHSPSAALVPAPGSHSFLPGLGAFCCWTVDCTISS